MRMLYAKCGHPDWTETELCQSCRKAAGLSYAKATPEEADQELRPTPRRQQLAHLKTDKPMATVKVTRNERAHKPGNYYHQTDVGVVQIIVKHTDDGPNYALLRCSDGVILTAFFTSLEELLDKRSLRYITETIYITND